MLHFIFYFMSILGLFNASILKAKLLSLDECQMDRELYDRQSGVSHNVTASASVVDRGSDTKVISGFVNIHKMILPASYSIRGYRLKPGGDKRLEFEINKLNCLNPVIDAVLKKLKIKYNKQCVAYPGTYQVPAFKLEAISSIFRRIVVRGRYMFDFEIDNTRGIITCLTLTLEMV